MNSRTNQDRSFDNRERGGYDRETLRGGDPRAEAFRMLLGGLFTGRGGGLEEDYRFGQSQNDPREQGNLGRFGRGGYDPTQHQITPQQLIERLREVETERGLLLSVLGINPQGRNIGQQFDVRDLYDLFTQFTQQQGRQQRDNQGVGLRGVSPKSVNRNDEHIKDEVITRLTEHEDIDPTDIEVQVKQGEVTITGTVAHRHEKLNIEHVVGNVIGVKDVQNQIKVVKASQERGEGGTNATGRQTQGRDQRPHAQS
jgi:osmotically-inducible protein OsmY